MSESDLIHNLILQSASLQPDAPALTYKNATLSYAEFAREVLDSAKGFLELGLQRNDRVGVFLEKRLEAVIAQFGASAAGGAFVPINPLLRAKQAAYILRNCAVRILVTSSARLAGLIDVLGGCPGLESIILVDEGHFDGATLRPQIATWKAMMTTAVGSKRKRHRMVDSDMAGILFTSGSTGMPKGVVLSHRNLVASARSACEHLRNTAEDRILCVLPFSFDYGLVQLTSAFNMCANVVLFDYLFPRDIPEIIAKEKVTGLAGVPPLWIQLAEIEWPRAATQSLRYVTSSGGAMPGATLGKLRKALGDTEIHLMYGLTEAFRSTCLPPSELERRPNSIGRPIPNADVMIVRQDQTLCRPQEVGELVHRGAFVSRGYWNDSAATAERFRPSPNQPGELSVPETAVWTGDMVWYDDDGFFYFVGRRDDQIKTSGYRVSPTEVEEVLYGTDLVAEAAAFGVPHLELGQAIVVVATAARPGQLDKESILEKCRQEMPTYMTPLLIIERQSIPRTPNGKMDRKQLADEFANIFQRSSE